MTSGDRHHTDQRDGGIYEIRLKGQLSEAWQDWFAGLRIALNDRGETILTGPVADQAALHGVLRSIRDLGLPLLAVVRLAPDADAPCQRDEKRG